MYPVIARRIARQGSHWAARGFPAITDPAAPIGVPDDPITLPLRERLAGQGTLQQQGGMPSPGLPCAQLEELRVLLTGGRSEGLAPLFGATETEVKVLQMSPV